MAETTAIEWCDSTFNPWTGCTKISPACDHCYAEGWAKRSGLVKWGGTRRRSAGATWAKPLKWQREAASFFAEKGRRRRVFCASLADVFDNQVPTDWRFDLWALIHDTPDLDWLILTKRPMNIAGMLPPFWDQVKGHVWLGTTVEDQKRAINLWHLGCVAQVHGCAVTFASFEPLLEQVDATRVVIHSGTATFYAVPSITHADILFNALRGSVSLSIPPLGWAIAGGESGPGARPSHPDWFRSLRDQCAAAGVPFLFKQWGEFGPVVTDADVAAFEEGKGYYGRLAPNGRFVDIGNGVLKVGKARAGRLLDGIEHNGFPEVRHG